MNQHRMSEPSVNTPWALSAVYFALSLLGLIGTWYFNLQFAGDSYQAAWFANPASSSAATDLITLLVMASVFYLREGSRLGWPWSLNLLFIPLSALLALAFAFPLFLGLRELQMARDRRRLSLG